MRYDYKYRINNKDKGDLAMELKELTSAEQVVMKCIWDYGKDMPLQQLIENLKQDYGKDYKKNNDPYICPSFRRERICDNISDWEIFLY